MCHQCYFEERCRKLCSAESSYTPSPSLLVLGSCPHCILSNICYPLPFLFPPLHFHFSSSIQCVSTLFSFNYLPISSSSFFFVSCYFMQVFPCLPFVCQSVPSLPGCFTSLQYQDSPHPTSCLFSLFVHCSSFLISFISFSCPLFHIPVFLCLLALHLVVVPQNSAGL